MTTDFELYELKTNRAAEASNPGEMAIAYAILTLAAAVREAAELIERKM